MSFRVSDPVTLVADVVTSGTFVVPYPVGTGPGSFFLSPNHKMSTGRGNYDSPTDFTLAFGASEITVTWRNAGTLFADTEVRLQLDGPGVDNFLPVVDASNVSHVPLKLIDFGTPMATDNDAFIAGATAGELPNGSAAEFVDFPFPTAGVSPGDGANQSGVLDVPRNIAVVVTHPSAVIATTVTVTGEDVFGKMLVQRLVITAGGTSKNTVGFKAFAKITNIRIGGTTGTDNIQANTVNVGFGGLLGLPIYIASEAQIITEYEDGVEATPGTVTVSPGTAAPMTDITNDVRGMYTPASVLNADRGFAILVADINPGYRGPAQFAG